MRRRPRHETILQEIFLTGTASLVWLAGLVFFFVLEKGKPYRFLGWAFVISMAEFIATRRKLQRRWNLRTARTLTTQSC
jgi:hypothetical protein